MWTEKLMNIHLKSEGEMVSYDPLKGVGSKIAVLSSQEYNQIRVDIRQITN